MFLKNGSALCLTRLKAPSRVLLPTVHYGKISKKQTEIFIHLYKFAGL